MNLNFIIKNEDLRKPERGNKNDISIEGNEDVVLKYTHDALKDNIESLLEPSFNIDLSVDDISIRSEFPTNDRNIYSDLKFTEGDKNFIIYVDTYVTFMDMISEDNNDFVVSTGSFISSIRYSDPECSDIPLMMEEDITPDKYPFLCLLLDNFGTSSIDDDGVTYIPTHVIDDNGDIERYYQYNRIPQ